MQNILIITFSSMRSTPIITFSSMQNILIITFSSMRSTPIITFSSSHTIQRYKEKGYVV